MARIAIQKKRLAIKMKKRYILLAILSILLLTGCTETQTVTKYQCADGSVADTYAACSPRSCPAISCPELDCSVCPAKVETKTETRTVTNTIYVCSDLREVEDKSDCIPEGDKSISTTINSHTISDTSWRGEADEGYEYHTFDLTVRNGGVTKLLMIDFKIKDSKGYIYDDDLFTSAGLLDKFDTISDIAPGDFVTGKIIFQIKTDAILSYLTVEVIDENYKTLSRNVDID